MLQKSQTWLPLNFFAIFDPLKKNNKDKGREEDEDDDELPMQGCVMRDRGEFSSAGYSEIAR